MDIQKLRSKIRPTTTVYLSWLLFGSHYACMGKWGTQILFWLTLGGLGIWAVIDLLTMTEKIIRHRESVFRKIEELETKEKIKIPVQIKFEPVPKFKLAMVG